MSLGCQGRKEKQAQYVAMRSKRIYIEQNIYTSILQTLDSLNLDAPSVALYTEFIINFPFTGYSDYAFCGYNKQN